MQLLREHKIEKLPIVDGRGRLTGLITVKDYVKSEQYPHATKDADGRLRVAAAIGIFEDAWKRAMASSTRGSTCSSSTWPTATPARCWR